MAIFGILANLNIKNQPKPKFFSKYVEKHKKYEHSKGNSPYRHPGGQTPIFWKKAKIAILWALRNTEYK